MNRASPIRKVHFSQQLLLIAGLALATLMAACGSSSSSSGGTGGGGGGGGGTTSISSLSPVVAMENAVAFSLTVNGSGFASGSRVVFNGTTEPTTLVNSAQLTAQIPSAALSKPGTAPVAVQTSGSTSGSSNFYVVPSISPQAVNVTAGPGATTTVNISVPPFTPPTLILTAVGLNNSAGATAVDVAQGTHANLFVVGNGVAAGTFFEVTGANNDVTVTEPVVSDFTSTTGGTPAVNFNINANASATLGARNLVVINTAGEVSVAVGSIVITAP